MNYGIFVKIDRVVQFKRVLIKDKGLSHKGPRRILTEDKGYP